MGNSRTKIIKPKNEIPRLNTVAPPLDTNIIAIPKSIIAIPKRMIFIFPPSFFVAHKIVYGVFITKSYSHCFKPQVAVTLKPLIIFSFFS